MPDNNDNSVYDASLPGKLIKINKYMYYNHINN